MKKLLCYNPWFLDLEKYDGPAYQKFFGMHHILGKNLILFDRSEVIRPPFNFKNLYPIPTFRKFDVSYEDLCNQRAKYLINLASIKNVKIYIMYSGGIDSTLVLISFLKNMTDTEKQNLVILLSQESIDENPNFYREHIVGKLNTNLSVNMQYVCNKTGLIVTGEPNDLVFGSVGVGELIKEFGEDIVYKKYSRELFLDFYKKKLKNEQDTIFCLDLLEKICNKAPIKLQNNFEVIWWLYFCCNWQNVILRPLMYLEPKYSKNIDQDFIENYYFGFYNTTEFQLWSMNNLNKRIQNTWESYKYIAKDIIYNFTKDADYRDHKVKVQSMKNVLAHFKSAGFLDEDFNFVNEVNLSEYYNPNNDFT